MLQELDWDTNSTYTCFRYLLELHVINSNIYTSNTQSYWKKLKNRVKYDSVLLSNVCDFESNVIGKWNEHSLFISCKMSQVSFLELYYAQKITNLSNYYKTLQRVKGLVAI